MRYVDIVGLDNPVSVIGLGTATRVFTPETYNRAAELLDAFLDAGGNCIDTVKWTPLSRHKNGLC